MRCLCATTRCACSPVFPRLDCNAAGLSSIAYRIGDFTDFRERLLTPRPGETELSAWRPGAQGDLAVQMMEWWAYLGDILTFYNERIANEAYLRTAVLPESVNHLVQLLGYRPKPALGAKATLAALLSASARLPVTVPAGLQVQSKPGPGQTPQIFEVDRTTTLTAPDTISTVVVPARTPLFGDGYFWLAGKVTLKAAERLLLIGGSALAAQSIVDFQWIAVTGTTGTTDPLGKPVTQVAFSVLSGSIADGARAGDYVLLKPSQSSPLWGYPVKTAAPVAQQGAAALITLAGTARSITPGSLVLLDVSDAAASAAALAASFGQGFDNATFDAFVASLHLGGWQGVADAVVIPVLVCSSFAAAWSSPQLAAGEGAVAFQLAIRFAASSLTGGRATLAAKVAYAFVETFDGAIDAAAGKNAVSKGLQNPTGSLPALAAQVAAALAAGFAAAGVKLPGGFAMTATILTSGFFRAFTGYFSDPGAFAVAVGDFAAGLATLTPVASIAASYGETLWYANGDGPNAPATPPPAIGIPAAQIAAGSLDTTGAAASLWSQNAAQVTMRWNFVSAGQLAPVLTEADLTWSGGNTALAPAPGQPAFPALPDAVLLEDAGGAAAAATLQPDAGQAATLGGVTPQPPASLASPISAFFNLVGVSRGKTVPQEILGSGNPAVAGQDFTLQNAPVTYVFDPASVSGPNFSSTVRVSVNGVQWREVQSFYGQAPNAQVFVLREDDAGKTHVTFGDGANGALLPTGTNTVTARYRYGAGYAAPAAETVTVVLTPTPGLKGLRNPLPPTGGGDPDQPDDMRQNAPRSVLTFDRAVSLDDYAAIALTASGVTQAVADYAFDALSQRPAVVLWVVGDGNATKAAGAVLAATALPRQGLRIRAARSLVTTVSLTYLRDPRYADSAVQAGLTAALLDPAHGLLGSQVLGIGQPVYHSQIAAACLAVPGVSAIQDVTLAAGGGLRFRLLRPGPILRQAALLPLGCDGQGWSPGPGAIIEVPGDGAHLNLTGVVSS